jgi:hypothetical protein
MCAASGCYATGNGVGTAGSCIYPETQCSFLNCANNTVTQNDYCNAGKCTPFSFSCRPYICGSPTTCTNTCSNDGQCIDGATCHAGGQCYIPLGGSGCYSGGPTKCYNGGPQYNPDCNPSDGYVACSSDPGMTNGACVRVTGGPCTHGTDCCSGSCLQSGLCA